MLLAAKTRLLENDSAWFGRIVPSQHHWRLYDRFKDEAVFLDIETDGYYGSITVVGLFDGQQTMTFVRGVNLERSILQRVLEKYKLIVTFNGASFDLPVMRRYFNIDGLKSIEKQLGIVRDKEVQGVSGSDAVYLWQQFRATRSREFLDLLVKYNEEDVINLPLIARKVIPLLWEKTRTKVA
jgi:uncharacterized protein